MNRYKKIILLLHVATPKVMPSVPTELANRYKVFGISSKALFMAESITGDICSSKFLNILSIRVRKPVITITAKQVSKNSSNDKLFNLDSIKFSKAILSLKNY